MVAKPEAIPTGDPSVVAMRVERINYIAQLEGTFALDAEQMSEAGEAMRPLNGLGSVEATQEGDKIGLVLEYTFAAVATSGVDSEDTVDTTSPFFSASARFLVEYQLDSTEPAAEADIQAFANINGRLNTIPYWREFLHNVLTRAGLPAYEVPTFNPVKIAKSLDPGDEIDN